MAPGFCAFAFLVALAASAAERDLGRTFSLSGFGTAGAAHNNTAGAEFIRDILQPRGVADGWSADVDSRLGLQLNARFNGEVEGMVQVVSYYNYAGHYDPALAWAFLSYSPMSELKARFGRLGWDVYMLSDSRHVGYSYLWVRPPVDYFGPLQLSHFDGADAVFSFALAGGLASTKIYGGWANQKIPSPPDVYNLAGSRVLGMSVDYQRGDWHARAGYTSVRIKGELPGLGPLLDGLSSTGSPTAAVLADDLSFLGKTVSIMSAGIVYDRGPWQAQLMFNRNRSSSLLSPQKDSGYLLLSYRTGDWTPYATVSGTRSKGSDRSTGFPTPNPLDDAVGGVLQRAQSRQSTLSLGVRYDFMRNADVKVQLDQIRVYDGAALLWRNAQPDWDGRATVFSVALDFVF